MHLFLALTAILLIFTTPIAVLVIVSRRRDAAHDPQDDFTDCQGFTVAGRNCGRSDPEIDGEGLGSLHGSEISDV